MEVDDCFDIEAYLKNHFFMNTYGLGICIKSAEKHSKAYLESHVVLWN